MVVHRLNNHKDARRLERFGSLEFVLWQEIDDEDEEPFQLLTSTQTSAGSVNRIAGIGGGVKGGRDQVRRIRRSFR